VYFRVEKTDCLRFIRVPIPDLLHAATLARCGLAQKVHALYSHNSVTKCSQRLETRVLVCNTVHISESDAEPRNDPNLSAFFCHKYIMGVSRNTLIANICIRFYKIIRLLSEFKLVKYYVLKKFQLQFQTQSMLVSALINVYFSQNPVISTVSPFTREDTRQFSGYRLMPFSRYWPISKHSQSTSQWP
jgi:hypothetical protein